VDIFDVFFDVHPAHVVGLGPTTVVVRANVDKGYIMLTLFNSRDLVFAFRVAASFGWRYRGWGFSHDFFGGGRLFGRSFFSGGWLLFDGLGCRRRTTLSCYQSQGQD
jgi:hypothetical protein